MSQVVAPRILLDEHGVTCVQSGSLVEVTMNRPEVRNAMRPSTWTALAAVGKSISDDVRAVVVRGAGEAFCSGLDRRLAAGDAVGDDAPLSDLFEVSQVEFDRLVAAYQEGFVWLRDPRFISVAAVQGYCMGAGFQLALACDVRVASDDAKFCMREAALGLVPDLTGTKHLVEAVGYSRALEWTATSRFVEAEEALATGAVNKVVPRADLDSAVQQMIFAVTAHPHDAVSATKSLLLGAAERTFDDQRAAERLAQFHRFAALAAAVGVEVDVSGATEGVRTSGDADRSTTASSNPPRRELQV
jgi:enoyl-CoA hydratase/carnithine racemase